MSQVKIVTSEFAVILDIGPHALFASLKPKYEPERNTFDQYKADCKAWEDLQTLTMRLRRSEKICYAGNALADAGAVLSKVGRGQEAAKFCGWGEQLWQMASAAYEEEEYYGKYRSVTDFEMA